MDLLFRRTSDEMWLKGVRLFDGTLFEQAKEEESLSSSLDNILPWEVVRIMAACHSLASVSNARHRETVVGDPLEKSVMKQSGFHLLRNNVVESVVENGASKDRRPVNILHRFAFSSKLKRMTVLVNETGGNEKLWALTKGAPETIKGLLSNESLPNDYDDVSFYHMSRGRRVLAMAFRDMGDFKKLQILKEGGREQVEHSLVFAGFLVLDCPLKPDSKKIISELQKSGHSVVMITGDAILTAAEVARQVGIIRGRSGNRIVYRIQKRASESGANALDPLSYFECVAMGSKDAISDAFDLSTDMVSKMQIDDKNGGAHICLSGDVLISIALIAAHVDKASPGSRLDTKVDEKNLLLSPPVQAVLVKLVPVVSVFARHAPHQKEAIIAAFNNGGLQTLMCGDGTNDVGALKRAHVGISIISAPEVESKQREAAAKISQVKIDDKKDEKLPTKDKKKKRAKTLEESMRQLRDAQEELDHVELGDASVAAPFTSRNVSIKCCKDVIQQGRCTLVTMLQIYKILGINCLVNALVLSKLFIHGGKQGDRQLTVLGIAVAALFYFVTRAEPLSVISHVRPPASVLCVQTFLSISGQCLIHMATILLATEAAIAFVDPYDPSLVPDGPFNPNVLNTCTFLLTCLSTSKFYRVLNFLSQASDQLTSILAFFH